MRGIAVDAAGHVYFSDGSSRVRKVDASSGLLSTIAGGIAPPCDTNAGDGGPASQASLCAPEGMAIDGTFLYVAEARVFIGESRANRVRRIDLATGQISTAASATVNNPGGLDFRSPVDVAVDSNHDLVIAANPYIFRLPAGSQALSPVSFSCLPHTLAIDASRRIYEGCDFNIRRTDADGTNFTNFAGTQFVFGYSGDGGPATSAKFKMIYGLRFDPAGRLLVADSVNRVIRRIENGIVTHFVGKGPTPPSVGLAHSTALGLTLGLAIDAQGNTYVQNGERILKLVAATGQMENYAGTGVIDFGAPVDGTLALSANLVPRRLAIGPANAVHFVNNANRIYRIDPATTQIARIAGTGDVANSGDGGLATNAGLTASEMAFDPAGNLYFSSTDAHVVRRIAAGTGIITTFAGTGLGGPGNAPGDGGPATSANLFQPSGLAIDAQGNVFIGEAGGGRIRRVAAATGIISTVAGAASGTIEDGSPGTSTVLGSVGALALDAAGNLFFRNGANRIRVLLASTGTIHTVVGGGESTREGEIGTRWNLAGGGVTLAMGPSGTLAFDEGNRFTVRAMSVAGVVPTPGRLDFPGRLTGTASLAKRIAIVNFSATPQPVALALSGSGFAMNSACPASLAPNAACMIDVTFTPPSSGAFTGSLDLLGGPASGTTLAGAGETSLVTLYYESILRRSPDEPGKAFWDGERSRMQGLGANVNEVWFAMSSAFYTSPEYVGFSRDASGFVTDLYRSFLNRAPDGPGLQFWTDQLSNGMPREVVLASFQHSAEFAAFTQGLFGNPAARAEVSMVMDFYRGLLGRLPDPQGFQGWVQQFRQSQCSIDPQTFVGSVATQMAGAFLASGEYVSRNRTNGQFVGDLYNALLRRGGELAGVRGWIDALDAGTLTRTDVRNLFFTSPEFVARRTAVAAQGCLP